MTVLTPFSSSGHCDRVILVGNFIHFILGSERTVLGRERTVLGSERIVLVRERIVLGRERIEWRNHLD